MSIDTFKPEVWSAVMLESLKKKLVYGGLANTDYEGDIAEFGDTVTINTVGRPTIDDYVPNSTVIVPEQLTTAQRKLTIDQAKMWAFYIDDVDARQARGPLLASALREAAYAQADVADQFMAGLYTGIQSDNVLDGVTIASDAPDDAYDNVLIPLKVLLDEADVPDDDRWCVLSPAFHGLLLRDDRFVRSDNSPGQTLRSGQVGEAAGFTIFKSNNTPSPGDGENVMIAGTNMAMSFANQITKTEAYRPQDAFEDAIKGLQLYGAKLTRPDGLACCTVTFS